jgi:hypothetical protein
MRHAHRAGVVLVMLGLAAAFLGLLHGQQIHRNSFEGRDPVWIKGQADTPFRELAHEITDAAAHTGQFSEHIQIASEQGSFVYYYYPTSRAPLTEDLSVHLWVRANRPGVQLCARLVLPKARNPKALDEPLTTILRGDVCSITSRWWPLELRRPVQLAKQQQQLMRIELQRDVDFTDAYIDQVMLNVYAGPGLTDVLLDDLEIGPVEETPPFQTTNRTKTPAKLLAPGQTPKLPVRAALVELDNGHLQVNSRPFFFRGIRHSDTPLKVLRDAGFNAVWFDRTTSPALMEEAINLGFWIVPALPVTDLDPNLTASGTLQQEIGRFLERDAVLFWDVGGGLTDEQTELIGQTARLVHSADPQRPIGADAWDGLKAYSNSLDLLGVHRWPLMTGLGLMPYREWLNQRRLLSRSGKFTWTWVQTHLPDWFITQAYRRPSTGAFDEPIGPQPEQIRLLTYLAISAGCRGLAFWSDRFLADSHQGRDRLLEMALLNQELRMLEPLLVAVDEEPAFIPTSEPNVQAAVLRSPRGVLVLPMWLGGGGQFVPGQCATAKLTLVVPQVPVTAQAWEVTPSQVRCLQQERVIGGTKITIPEFGMTSAVVFTSDNGPQGIVVRFQQQVRETSKLAAQWAHDLAEEEIRKVAIVEQQLESAGHTLPDGQKLLENARKRLAGGVVSFNHGDYPEASAEADRALRPVRILMRAQWEKAIHDLDTPVASPYAVSFYTLPRHWHFLDLVKQGRLGANQLADGDFENVAPTKLPAGWTLQETTLDEVNMAAAVTTNLAKEGKQSLALTVLARDRQQPAPLALERTYLAVNSPKVRLQPGSVVRVSAWVQVPAPVAASVDGTLLFDSAGGEPLAVRITEPTKGWKQFALYRTVPPSGEIWVTLALTGLATVYFDDVRIEPLVESGVAPQAAE